MKWWQTSLILCTFGFLKEFRPSEPFISPYLNGEWKNFTEEQINQEIYPVGTYSTMALLIIVFLLTDLLRYKPVIVLEGVCGILTWGILSWGKGIPMMQVAEFFYGAFCATEVAYSTYLYAKVDKKYYQKVTSQTKTAILVGKSGSGFIAQMLVLYCLMDYQQLHYLTVTAMALATVWSLFLPSVPKSTYFNRMAPKIDLEKGEGKQKTEENQTEILLPSQGNISVDILENKSQIPVDNEVKDSLVSSQKKNSTFSWIKRYRCQHLWNDFNLFLNDKYVVKWSIWWSLSMCGYLQVTSYMQLLWQVVINEEDRKQILYHGFSNCAHSLIGAVCTYLAGFIKIKWELYGELILAVCSILQGGLLFYSAHMSSVLTGYILYILYKILYQVGHTISSSEIAKGTAADSYALVFGFDTFMALLAQSALTMIVIDLLRLDIRLQFQIYGGYYLLIGLGFLLAGTLTLCRNVVSNR